MAYAISAWFDLETEATVKNIWKMLHEKNLCSTFHAGPYRPHITLAIYDTLDIQDFSKNIKTIARKSMPFSFSLSEIRSFKNPKGLTVYLATQANSDLLSIQEIVHHVAQQFGSNPRTYYLQDRWTPHCTIASGLNQDAINKIVASISGEFALPIQGIVDRIGLIETPKEIEIDEFYLGTGQPA